MVEPTIGSSTFDWCNRCSKFTIHMYCTNTSSTVLSYVWLCSLCGASFPPRPTGRFIPSV